MQASSAAYRAVSNQEMGDASTLVKIVQRLGGAIGAVGMVIILQHTGGGSSSTAGIRVFGALAMVSLLTLVTAWSMRRQAGLQGAW